MSSSSRGTKSGRPPMAWRLRIYENMTERLTYPEDFFRVDPEDERMLRRFFDEM